MLKILGGLLIVVFLLSLYGALKLANEADKEMKKSRSEENQNEKRK